MLRYLAKALGAANHFDTASNLGRVLVFGDGGFGARALGLHGENRASEHPEKDQRHRAGTASRFPEPWQIVEIPNGFVVNDAAGQQLGIFYARADQNTAGHTAFLTMGEARQLAVDFAKLPVLLK